MAQQNLWRLVAWYATDNPQITVLIDAKLIPATTLPDAKAAATAEIDTAYNLLIEPAFTRAEVQGSVEQLSNNVQKP